MHSEISGKPKSNLIDAIILITLSREISSEKSKKRVDKEEGRFCQDK